MLRSFFRLLFFCFLFSLLFFILNFIFVLGKDRLVGCDLVLEAFLKFFLRVFKASFIFVIVFESFFFFWNIFVFIVLLFFFFYCCFNWRIWRFSSSVMRLVFFTRFMFLAIVLSCDFGLFFDVFWSFVLILVVKILYDCICYVVFMILWSFCFL